MNDYISNTVRDLTDQEILLAIGNGGRTYRIVDQLHLYPGLSHAVSDVTHRVNLRNRLKKMEKLGLVVRSIHHSYDNSFYWVVGEAGLASIK